MIGYSHTPFTMCQAKSFAKTNYSNALALMTNITSLILEDVVFQSSTKFLPFYTLMNAPSLFIHALQLF
jgi:hypothetical protein